MRWSLPGWLGDTRPRSGLLADLGAAPVAPRDTPLVDVDIVAVDLEATGLDPRTDEVLSIGLVPVRAGQVLLHGARQVRVRPQGDVGHSATVHGLTDDALAAASPLEEVLPEVLGAFLPEPGGAAYRRVLLAHFARVETTFLGAAARRLLGGSVRLQVVDTMEIERQLVLRAQPHEVGDGQLRLDACRRRRGLPRYRAHSALTDALACAELFLAQCAEIEERRQRPLTLGDVAVRGLR